MELKNAGLTNEPHSRKEARIKLMDGNDFFSDDGKRIYYDDQINRTPFRVDIGDGGSLSAEPLFDCMEDWQAEVDWKEELSPENPRWSRAWINNGSFVFAPISIVIDDAPYPFTNKRGDQAWRYAEPVSAALAALLDAEIGNA